ncbi:hypothetical protein SMF913_13034 [Streptomyces malaysiensis]|uniref:Uncharacterized protein n=1 Tax=Streptomyces malaysiensis TaxID=92644 RepID=A0A2J7Z9Y5_STRMQ|nr:hypothetical protein SMF913_13034 [Streptomyces malaysiensis]
MAAFVHVQDRGVDGGVGGPVVIGRGDDLGNVEDGLGAEEHSAESGLFGVQVVRRDGFDVVATEVVDVALVAGVFRRAHAVPLGAVVGRPAGSRLG